MTKRRLHHAATLPTGGGQYTSSKNNHVSIILCRGVIVSQAFDEADIMRLPYRRAVDSIRPSKTITSLSFLVGGVIVDKLGI